MNDSIKRRRFLSLLGSGLFSVLALPYYSVRQAHSYMRSHQQPSLLGKLYLDQHPEDGYIEFLRHNVPSSPELYRKAVIADFRDGRTCIIDGWILSVTECRNAAMNLIA